jgi:hypothetical protein
MRDAETEQDGQQVASKHRQHSGQFSVWESIGLVHRA